MRETAGPETPYSCMVGPARPRRRPGARRSRFGLAWPSAFGESGEALSQRRGPLHGDGPTARPPAVRAGMAEKHVIASVPRESQSSPALGRGRDAMARATERVGCASPSEDWSHPLPQSSLSIRRDADDGIELIPYARRDNNRLVHNACGAFGSRVCSRSNSTHALTHRRI